MRRLCIDIEWNESAQTPEETSKATHAIRVAVLKVTTTKACSLRALSSLSSIVPNAAWSRSFQKYLSAHSFSVANQEQPRKSLLRSCGFAPPEIPDRRQRFEQTSGRSCR